MPADQPLNFIRELDHRAADGLEVRLLWNECDGRVTVAVHDDRTGDAFAVPVLAHDSAVEVFDHPFAYAAERGIRTSDLELQLMLDAPPAG